MTKTGREKNAKNKAKHSKFMAQKANKLREKEANRKVRLMAIIEKAKEK